MDKVTCPKCGQEIETGRMRCEENVIGVSDHQVIFVSRKFEADCPQCGPVLCHSVGHHGTIAKKELKTLFPKPQLVRRKLSKDERKLFDQTMSGKRIAKDGEVERWRQVLNEAHKALR